MTDRELAGKTALMTGGSRGIGRAICRRLAEAGAKVAVNYVRDAEAAEVVKAEIEGGGGIALAVKADASDPDQVDDAVRAVEQALGSVDLLVCNAGISRLGEPGPMTYETWRRIVTVNLDGTFLPIMAVKEGMIERGYGRIVCIASDAGLRPRPLGIEYATSKAAVIAFVRNCSAAFAPENRINTVAPGLIDTDLITPMDPKRREAA